MSEQCFSMEKVIEVTNISKTFSGRKVLDNVSISVQRGVFAVWLEETVAVKQYL